MNLYKFKIQLLMIFFAYFGTLTSAQTPGPTNMGGVINTSARDAEPTFTPDGNTMYFNCFDREGETGSDICVTQREGDGWSEPTIVWEVSTQDYLEVEPLLSPDAQQLYIMSNRPGGMGGQDFYPYCGRAKIDCNSKPCRRKYAITISEPDAAAW